MPKKKKKEEEKKEEERYIRAVGRRKTATAVVKIYPKKEKEIIVNDKKLEEYFPYFEYQQIVKAPLEVVDTPLKEKGKIVIIARGGGKKAQSEAARLAISRALVKMNEEYKKVLRAHGFLTRDPRMKERKKFGLKKARRAPQWQKR